MERETDPLSRAAIEATAARIAPYIRRTPVLLVDGADVGVPDVRLAFKLEFTQRAGSFKTRGAFCNLLERQAPPAGVAAASGGNHGVAVAYAAMRLKIPATIFVPSVSSPAKIDQIRAYGANLRIVGERYADALAASEEFVRASGAMPVHAFDQLHTLLGQGTVGLELEQDAPPLDAVLVSVGGGGLIGGIAAWFRGRIPVVGVEPELAPTLTHALAAGRPVDAPAGGIAADSLAPRRVGEIMFPLAQRFISTTALVSDEALRAAQIELWKALHVVVEPGGVAAFTALHSGRWKPKTGQTIGVVLSGGNTTAVKFD